MSNPFSSVKFLYAGDNYIRGLISDNWQGLSPIKANIDPTNVCNQNCVWCYNSEFRERSPVSMSLEDIKYAIEQVAKLGCKAVLFSGGEPLCNDKVFPEAFYYCRKCGMKCALNTNGTLMHKYLEAISETCTYVKVSVDAGCRQTYKELHRDDSWDKVWRNISNLRKVYKGSLGVDFLIHPKNHEEVFNFLYLAHNHHLDYAGVRPVLLGGFRLSDDIFDSVGKQVVNFKLHVGESEFSVFTRLSRSRERWGFAKCLATPLTVTIGADMNVYVCCLARGHKELISGNLREQTLKEIWSGERRKKVVESIDVTKCLPCMYSMTNKILNQMKGATHLEFI